MVLAGAAGFVVLIAAVTPFVETDELDPDETALVANAPPDPGNSKGCSDFATQEDAQAWFDTYDPFYGDVAVLDLDGDGNACERLPKAVADVTTTSTSSTPEPRAVALFESACDHYMDGVDSLNVGDKSAGEASLVLAVNESGEATTFSEQLSDFNQAISTVYGGVALGDFAPTDIELAPSHEKILAACVAVG